MEIVPEKLFPCEGSRSKSARRRRARVSFDYALRAMFDYLAATLTVGLPRAKQAIWVQGTVPEEFEAAGILLRSIRDRTKNFRWVYSSGSPSTLDWLRAKFNGGEEAVCPLPRDLAAVVSGFLRSFNPRLVILLDTRDGLGKKAIDRVSTTGIPLVAMVTRERAPLLPEYFLSALQSDSSVVHVCVPTHKEANLLVQQGVQAQKITVAGDIRFDYRSPALTADSNFLREKLGITENAPVLIAAGTSLAETQLFLEAYFCLKQHQPDLVLLLEPGGHRRADCFVDGLDRKGLSYRIRSEPVGTNRPDVVLFDLPGELPIFFAIASAVLAGGTFKEPGVPCDIIGLASGGAPVVVGPFLDDESANARLLIDRGAILQISGQEIFGTIQRLLRSKETCWNLIRNADQIIANNNGASFRILEDIQKLIPATLHEAPVSQSWRTPTLRDHAGQSKLWKLVARPFMKRRIDDWETLKERLGRPRAILCLGNGPSSEDPRLRTIDYDCLIRVNWRWKDHSTFVDPKLVFVGDPLTLQHVRNVVFAFWNYQHETGMLLRYLVTHGLTRMEYFVMARLSPIIRSESWEARPTNGAMMVVAAAALQPERLIISGIDLYRHPHGRYPWSLTSFNEYHQVHSYKTELEIIRLALQDYRGELIVLSDNLSESLKDFQNNISATC